MCSTLLTRVDCLRTPQLLPMTLLLLLLIMFYAFSLEVFLGKIIDFIRNRLLLVTPFITDIVGSEDREFAIE